ncbi:unnamed protein product, partial [Staurois parvus]
ASVVRQAGSISIGQVGRVQGEQAENGQGHKPGIRSSRMVRQARDQSRVSRESDRNRNRKQGPGETHTPRQSLQVWPSLKYTSISSFRCFAGCKVESLIAGSTRWPALVLQLIRQVIPTIAGQSIPDRHI